MKTNGPLRLITNAIPNPHEDAALNANLPFGETGLVEVASATEWLMRGGLALGLLALAWWGWRTWQRRAMASGPAETPAARARRLLREALSLQTQPELFVSRVSDILRQFLEEQFGLNAPDRTTEEFLEEVRDGGRLGFDHQVALGHFLSQCDLVKFARHEPDRHELDVLHNSALGLVDEVTSPGRPPEKPEPAMSSGTETVATGVSEGGVADPDSRYLPAADWKPSRRPGGGA